MAVSTSLSCPGLMPFDGPVFPEPVHFRHVRGEVPRLQRAGWSGAHPGLTLAPPLLQPVIDPGTGRIDKTALRCFVDALVEALPPLPAGSASVRHARHARLVADLRRIGDLAAGPNDLPPHEMGLQVRHGFAAAADSARKLARNLDASRFSRLTPEPALACGYAGIAALLVELKRAHLSAAAPDLMSHYAAREARNLERAGFRSHRQGDLLHDGGGASLSWSTGAWTLGGGSRTNRMHMLDDDADAYYVEMLRSHVQAAAGAEFGSWKAKAGPRLDINAGRELFAAADTEGLVKLVVNLQANRARFDSAGPKARKALDALDAALGRAAKCFGKGHVPAPGAPIYLSDAKLAKGLNGTRIELIAGSIDAALGDHEGGRDRFAALLAAAYPPIEHQVRHRLDGDAALPADLLHKAVPPSLAYRGKPLGFRQASLGVDAKVGIGTGGAGVAGIGVGFAAGASQGSLQFFLWLANAAHELLDAGFAKDLRTTLALHGELDAHAAAGRAHLHRYTCVARELGGEPCDEALSDGERDFYRAEAAIPAQFRDAIAHPGVPKLQAAADVCERLGEDYLALVGDARRLLAEPDRFLDAAQRKSLQALREAAFRRLDERVWGGRFPGGLQAALKDPRAFVARSHDALSLALGCAGTHLAIQKRQLAQDASRHDDAHRRAVREADRAYAKARRLFDGGFLPITRQKLMDEHASLRAEALFQRHDTVLKVGASIGLDNPPVGELLDATAPSLGTLSVASDAGRLAFAIEARYQRADVQVNAGRLGEYLQLSFSAQAGAPLLGDLVGRALVQAIEKLMPGATAETLQREAGAALRQLQGLALQVSAGASVVVKLRKAPGAEGYDLQFVRVLATRASGLDAVLPLPTPVGVFNIGASSGTSMQSAVLEVTGADLGYQMLHWPKLEALLDLEKKGASARELFEADPALKNAYFGSADLLPVLIDRHLAFEAALREGDTAARDNEFFRYYASEPFARVVRLANEAARHAPGCCTCDADDPFAPVPTLAAPAALPEGFDWEQAKARIAQLKTADERAAYYTGEGRAVLDAFARVVGAAAKVNAAAMMHAGERSDGFAIRAA